MLTLFGRHDAHGVPDAHEGGALEVARGTELVPYVIEPDEIYVPVRFEAKRHAAPRRRGAKIAIGAGAVMLLVVATAVTLMAGARVTTPSLPAPPPALAARLRGPAMPLATKELPVVDGLSGITSDPLFASPAQLAGVMLVRSEDRTSLAFEMTAEPGKATLRTISPTAVEIEAGPIVGSIPAEAFLASAVPLLREVSIRTRTRDHREYLQARVIMNAAGGADVRVVGRVVYVDVAPVN